MNLSIYFPLFPHLQSLFTLQGVCEQKGIIQLKMNFRFSKTPNTYIHYVGTNSQFKVWFK